MRRLLFFLLITFSTHQVFPCICGQISLKKLQQNSYENSELILIGDVIEADQTNGTYTLQIVELLKGKYRSVTIQGKTINSCSGFPEKGRWIIYGNIVEDFLDFSQCDMSRSFREPHWVFVNEYKPPAPPSPYEKKNAKSDVEYSLQFETALAEIRQQAITDLKNEIILLREKE